MLGMWEGRDSKCTDLVIIDNYITDQSDSDPIPSWPIKNVLLFSFLLLPSRYAS